MNQFIRLSLIFLTFFLISQLALQARTNNSSFRDSLTNPVSYKGLYLGVGFNPVLPVIKRTTFHQKGLGYGANLNLMYISDNKFGARIAYARWISPKSDYETKSRVIKIEGMYVFPSGLEFHLGGSNKSGEDVDGHGEITNGFYLGAGKIINTNLFFNFHFQFSAHHYFHYHQERLLFDGNIGITIPIIR